MILLSSNGAGSILLLVGYIAIFAAIMYFAAIRPQKKQQKKQQEMINSMEKGRQCSYYKRFLRSCY